MSVKTQENAGSAIAEPQVAVPPGRYSTVAEEYQALTQGTALLDRSPVGRLSFSGEDAVDLLNRLSTNDLMALEVGKGTPTVLTSNKGRILGLLFVLRLDDRIMVLTAPETRGVVMEWIDFYTFGEDVSVDDLTDETGMLSMAGPHAARFLDDVSGASITSLERYDSVSASIEGEECTIVRTDFASLPGYDLIVSADAGPRLWEGLSTRGQQAGLRPVGVEALEVVRVEQGVPAYGKELSEDYNPLEAGLREYISFTKGCYVGQEVVTRLDTYKKVRKRLVGFQWTPGTDSRPSHGAKLLVDGKQAGVVTSAATSPRLKKGIGLAYVGKAHAEPGTVLSAELDGGQAQVEVVGLPF